MQTTTKFKQAGKKDAGKPCVLCGHVMYIAKGVLHCDCENPTVYQIVTKK